jgi:tryptophan synthase beta chain
MPDSTHVKYILDEDKTPAAINEALEAREAGQERVIVFNLSGHAHFDMAAYDSYFSGKLTDYEYPAEAVAEAQKRMPQLSR